MYKEIDAILENTIFKARYDEYGNILSYLISPTAGYKLHEITLDENIVDEETFEPTGKKRLGYTKSYITAGCNYDFEKNYREIYAKPDNIGEEIVDVNIDKNNPEIEEKAKAYDILMGDDD